jgi:signal transduction histidine kinase
MAEILPEEIKVLIVDDDEDDVFLIRDLLREGSGRAVPAIESASSWSEALAHIDRSTFDIFVFDYWLGEKNGLELLRTVRAKGIATPVVMLTGQGDEELAVAAMKEGAADYLVKSRLSIESLSHSFRYAINIHKEALRRRQAEEALQKAHDELEKRVEERTAELRLAYDQLLHAEKLSAIGKLSASIAHEINNPLFGIRNIFAGIRKRSVLEEDDAELVELAMQECDRIKLLVHSLRDFNRPTSGVVALVDLHHSIDGVLLLLKKEFQNKKIRVEKHFTRGMLNISAVSDQIKQVLLNLLTNAIEAIPEGGGNIRVTTEALDNWAAVRVRDSGGGIEPDDLHHIFEPFFTTKSEAKGTGLGLSVSHGIISKHGGRIEVESEPGQGSTFTILLPIQGK